MARLRVVLVFLFALFLVPLLAQEVCDNGVDDDGDGLIDLQDEECICEGILGGGDLTQLIPNPSFEDFLCCPSGFAQMNCVDGWQQGSSATTDYMHTCGFILPAVIDVGLVPFPGGAGVVGAVFSDGWKEYLASCLNDVLESGGEYTLTFQFATVPVNNDGSLCNSGGAPYGPAVVSLFGNASCNGIPVGGSQCPSSADPSWIQLGTASFTPDTNWVTLSITFTAPADINAIMLGPPCVLPPGYGGSPCLAYMLFDDLMLEGETLLTELELDASGLPCDLDFALSASVDHSGGTWQWYHNGVAITGENAEQFSISANNYLSGTYQVTYTTADGCVSDSLSVTVPPRDTSELEVFFCPGSNAGCAGETFSEPGLYEVVLTDAAGCDSIVNCTVTEYVLSPTTYLEFDTCAPFSVKVCGDVYTETGYYEITCTDYRGCDSLIVLDLRLLDPKAVITPPGKLKCGEISDVLLDGSTSPINPFPAGTMTYEWLGPPDGFNGALDEAYTFVTKPAQYCLVVTWENNGAICRDTTCVTVEQDKGGLQAPVIIAPQGGCLGDTLLLERKHAGPAPYDQAFWITPPGLGFENLNDSTIRFIPTKPGTAIFCAYGSSECGVSDTTCVEVVASAADTVLLKSATCDPKLAGISVENLTNRFGCDSTVIRDVSLLPSQTILLTGATCDPALAGTDTLFLQNQYGCDSLIITGTLLSPSNQTSLTLYTCDPQLAGKDTLLLSNQYGCDSTVYREFIYTGVYQETAVEFVCGAGADFLDTLVVTSGPCDSLFITEFVHVPLDTVFLSGSTCDPTQAGVFSQVFPTALGCDSTVITTILQLPSDNILIQQYTCDKSQAGLDSLWLQNRFGCDSLVRILTLWGGVDTQFIQLTTCDPALAGTQTLVSPGPYCDTVRVLQTALLPTSQTVQSITICEPSGPSSDTLFLQNQYGCDSLAVRQYSYVDLATELTLFDERCAGDRDGQIVIDDVAGGLEPLSYRLGGGSWQATPLFAGLLPGTYTVTVRDARGCQDTLSGLAIGEGIELVLDAGPDRQADRGTLVDLAVQSSHTLASLEWNAIDPLSCASCPQTQLGPLLQTQTVTVRGTTADGCEAEDFLQVLMRIRIDIYIPNSFSPDNDGINDIFSVFGNDLVKKVRNMAIYDRWGNSLYYREDLPLNDPGEGWDGSFRGRVMDPGVYVYVVEAELYDGSVELLKGDVTLVR